MEGPPGTAYENGFFLFEIMISQNILLNLVNFILKQKSFVQILMKMDYFH